MPKAYSEQQRREIVRRLKQEALSCMAQYGVRRTTVDELVKRVNIPKGTFYLFYPSKELLLFDAINDVHDRIHQKLLSLLPTVQGEQAVDSLTDLLFSLFKEVDNTKLAVLLLDNEFELILRRLPEEKVKEHFQKDALSFEQLAACFPGMEDKPLAAYEAAFRAVFLTLLHRREIGEDQFDESFRLLVRGLVLQLLA